MARPYRIQGEDLFYHIISRGDNRKKIFISDNDFNKFLEIVKDAKAKYKFYLYAYCLMGNHYHLFIETTQPNLSRIMQYINTAYTMHYNKKRNKCGHLFQGRFKSILVEADIYLKELTRYIHLNPVKAKIVSLPQKYKWSSYNAYIKKTSDIIDIDRVKTLLDMNISQYPSFVIGGINKITDPFKTAYAGFILGSKSFVKDQLKELAIQIETKDFAYKKEISSNISSQDIIENVARHFNQTSEELKTSNKRPMAAKKMAIYLIRQNTPLTNNQIGELFNMKFSAVSKAAIDFKEQIGKNKKLKKVVEGITSKMEV